MIVKIIFDHLHGHVLNDRVFCEAFVIPEGESEDDLLDLGFLPNMQPPLYWYQAKSCRINNEKINLSYRKRKKLAGLTIKIFDYQEKCSEVDPFFKFYINERKLDLESSYEKNSKLEDLKVMEISLGNDVVAFTRFREFEKVILGLETAFSSGHPKMSLGTSAILLLSFFGKSINKNFVYIYESYENYFPYKLTIPGVEFWEGENWVGV